MVWFMAIAVWGLFFMLILMSRAEQGNVLQKASMYLYKKICMSKIFRRERSIHEKEVLQNLVSLHPGISTEQVLSEYYAEKIRIVLMIMLIGCCVACLAEFSTGTKGLNISNGVIRRTDEKKTITLEASIDNEGEKWKEKITLDIWQQKLEEEEAKLLFEQLITEMDEIILGNNLSVQEVKEKLSLPHEVKGYPFSIVWKSSDPALVAADGVVHTDSIEKPTEVALTAEITYMDWSWIHNWNIYLYPPDRTEREQLIYDLTKLSYAAEEEQRYEDVLLLPTEVDGRSVSWEEEKENSGLIILLVVVLTAVCVYKMKDKDLQDELVKRRRAIKEEYAVIVSKYALLLEAGMTVRGAFVKICRDQYEKENSLIHPLYEEMNYSCNELKAGVSESKVYENFGKRTGVPEYMRLCALLNQNLKKGNTALAKRLKEECDNAERERLQMKKGQGEEAGTKLLAPMGMILIMILIMIVIPAFSGLGI